MDYSVSQYIQLIVGLTVGVLVFYIAYSAKPRVVLVFLLLLVPFQPIMTRYGSLNMVLTYLVGMAFLLRGELRRFPLAWAVMFIGFAYLLSLSQVLPATFKYHVFTVLSIGGNFILFYLVYNILRKDGDIQFGLRIFTWISALVAVYFVIAMATGFQGFSFMGIDELSLTHNLEKKRRLIGPFNAAEISSDFLAIQVLLLGYALLYENDKWRKLFLILLMLASFGFLVATGSRGGFIGLVVGGVLFMFLFRNRLGTRGLLRVGAVTLGLVIVSVVVIATTDFNVMFERLEGTKIDGLELDTRKGLFEHTMERIVEEPLLGHGPRLVLPDADKIRIPGYKPLGHNPHSLYLFLGYTLGLVGFVAYIAFFIALMIYWWQRRCRRVQSVEAGIPQLGLLLTFVFLLTEYRIEFLRFTLNDYQNYMFALWGMLLAYTGLERNGDRVPGDNRYSPVPDQKPGAKGRQGLLQPKRRGNR